MSTLLTVIVQFFRQPALVFGLVALIGLIAMRKSWQDVTMGTLKTMLGFLAMGVGSSTIVSNLGPITTMINKALGLEGIYPHDIIVSSSIAAKLGTEVGLILGLGFIVNLLVARFTKFKYVFLTGNYLFIYAATWTALLNAMGFSSLLLIILGSIIQGVFCAIMPAISQPLVRKMLGDEEQAEFAIGHGHVVGTWLGIGASLLFGKDKHRLDGEGKVTETGAFFRDMSVIMTLVMLVLIFLLSFAVGPKYVQEEISGGQNFIIFGILTALSFTVGVLVLLYGVRLFLQEMIPAFRGFAKKIVPGAIPALDIPVLFVYGPTALLVGFLTGLLGQFVAILLLAALRLPTPIPSMIPAFFISGGASILANHYAGRRAAFITGFLWSFVDFVVASIVYKFDIFGLTQLEITNQIFHSLDGMTFGTLIRVIGSVFGL